MKLKKFIEITEATFDFEKAKKKEKERDIAKKYGGKEVDPAAAYGTSWGEIDVGTRPFARQQAGEEVGIESPERLNKLKETLVDTLRLLPKYGLVSEDSPEWEKFKGDINRKLKTKAFRGPETIAIERGLQPWILSLKEIESNVRGQKNSAEAREYMARILREKIRDFNRTPLNREPLRIIDSINRFGKLFPERKLDPSFKFIKSKKPGLEPDYDVAKERGAVLPEKEEEGIELKHIKLSKKTINRIRDIMGNKADKFIEEIRKKKEKKEFLSKEEIDKLLGL